jgi:membrane-associated phospholipid phosphatase
MSVRTGYCGLGFVVVAVLGMGTPAAAQQPEPDSATFVRARRPLVRVGEAIGVAATTGLALALDRTIRDRLADPHDRIGRHLSDLGNGFGDGVVVYSSLLAVTLGGKLLGKDGMYGVGMRALQSTLVGGGAAVLLKNAIGRERPNSSPTDPYNFSVFEFKDNSFPSGHTTVAFALATSLARETPDQWTDAGFFLLATLTAYARMHDDKHWASDVVFGAGLGILSARFIHRLHARIAVSRGMVGASVDF